MSIAGVFVFVVAVWLLIGIVKGLASSGGETYDEDDLNQFAKCELDPSNPNNLMLRDHRNDDLDELLYSHAIEASDEY